MPGFFSEGSVLANKKRVYKKQLKRMDSRNDGSGQDPPLVSGDKVHLNSCPEKALKLKVVKIGLITITRFDKHVTAYQCLG